MRKGKEQERVFPGGRDWGLEAKQVNNRHGETKAGSWGGQKWWIYREFQEVVLHGMGKNTLLRLPEKASKTGQSPGDLCEDITDTHKAVGGFRKHHVEYTGGWPKREYPERDRATPMGQRQWKERGDMETKSS